jgi:hypothetical protein
MVGIASLRSTAIRLGATICVATLCAAATSADTPSSPAQGAGSPSAPAPQPSSPAQTSGSQAPSQASSAGSKALQVSSGTLPADPGPAAQGAPGGVGGPEHAAQDAAAPQRTFKDPFESPPFPFSVFDVNNGYPVGESWDYGYPTPMQDLLVGHAWDKSRWKMYGWLDLGINLSTAHNTNFPVTYDIVPNTVQLDQIVWNIERLPDTVQTQHDDWGFHTSLLYGLDYRFTTSKGWFSDQLLNHNSLYGADPVLVWGMYYAPHLAAEGVNFQFGRYISPADIEAQLAQSNYLYTHSLMFSVDPYTYTGANAQIRLSKMWMILVGLHAGNDMAPWSAAATPNGELMFGWNDKDNRNAAWFGMDSFGDGHYRDNHVNEQVLIGTFSHKYSDRLHQQTQGYYIYQYDARVGGTVVFGSPTSYAASGQGAIVKGQSSYSGMVTYLEYKLNKRDYLSFRTDFLNDPSGTATGLSDLYTEVTLGYAHNITSTLVMRPEIRYDMSVLRPGYDINGITGAGAKSNMFTFNVDFLQRF